MHRQAHCTTSTCMQCMTGLVCHSSLTAHRYQTSAQSEWNKFEANHKILLSNFAIMVCRVLKKHMPFSRSFGSRAERHINHIYYAEMSKKSSGKQHISWIPNCFIYSVLWPSPNVSLNSYNIYACLHSSFFWTQVPLGILPKSENKHEDMISILDHLYKYVPTLTSTETIANLHTSAQVSAITNGFHYVLFGWDMVTAKRARE